MVMDRMGFNPISLFTGLFNGQQKKNGLSNGAKDRLKSVTCEHTLSTRFYARLRA